MLLGRYEVNKLLSRVSSYHDRIQTEKVSMEIKASTLQLINKKKEDAGFTSIDDFLEAVVMEVDW